MIISCVCVYIYIYVCVCVYVCVCMYVRARVCVCFFAPVREKYSSAISTFQFPSFCLASKKLPCPSCGHFFSVQWEINNNYSGVC